MSSVFDGRRVVLTRPVGRSEELRARLESLGAVVDEAPLLDVAKAPDGGDSLREGLRHLSEGDWIVLTSASAVDGLLDAVGVERLVGFRFAAVGGATASALEDAGVLPSLVGDGRGGASLAKLLGNAARAEEPILLALAAEPIPDLEVGLRSAGFAPLVATAYATVERELSQTERRALEHAEVVVLTSPKGVQLASAALGKKRPRIVVMGPTTSAAAVEAGFTQISVPPSPGIEGLLVALEGLLGTA